MGSLADGAKKIVGKSRSEYQCNHVVNELIFGNKYQNMRAVDYKNWGKEVKETDIDEGVVVVGKNGAHVGVFISKHEFIHSSTTKYEVIKAPISQLKWVFTGGYLLRKAN